ncbi:MAG: nitroreductase/quinone reductase family protein [Myxococcota bacterium]
MRLRPLLYAALNVPMRALLRSPLHRIASGNLCLLRYRGRRSGRRYATPLSYVREGERLWLLSSRDTRWWTSFTPGPGVPAPVEVLVAGTVLRGRARTIQHARERLRDTARRFLTALPRDAMVYGIGLDHARRPKEDDLERALDRLVLVEVEIEIEEDEELEGERSGGQAGGARAGATGRP